MLAGLEKAGPPDWLQEVVASRGKKLDELDASLAFMDSVFFPWSGFNDTALRDLAGHFYSFVYVDEEWKPDGLARAAVFERYRVLAQRQLEIVVAIQDRGPATDQATPELRRSTADALWLIFKRKVGFRRRGRPVAFSVLLVRHQPMAAYEALYLARGFEPACIEVFLDSREGTESERARLHDLERMLLRHQDAIRWPVLFHAKRKLWSVVRPPEFSRWGWRALLEAGPQPPPPAPPG